MRTIRWYPARRWSAAVDRDPYTNLATLEWARQWPIEEVWKAERRG